MLNLVVKLLRYVIFLFDYKNYLFDPNLIRNKNKIFNKSKLKALKFYEKNWLNFDLKPNNWFDPLFYVEQNPDVKNFKYNPLYHYLLYGFFENRIIKKETHNWFFKYKDKKYNEIKIKNKSKSSPNILIHLHLHYYIEGRILINKIKNIKIHYDLLITYSSKEIEKKISYLTKNIKQKKYLQKVENKGRNILPLIKNLKWICKKYEIVIHAHTKRSPHLLNGKDWFNELSETILGSNEKAVLINNLFLKKNAGLVFPNYHKVIVKKPNFGKVFFKLNFLIMKLKKKIIFKCFDFPAGSFFWISTKSLNKINKISGLEKMFSKENGAKCGNMEHAIERLIGFLPQIASQNTFILNPNWKKNVKKFKK